MSVNSDIKGHSRRSDGHNARERLLAGTPVKERRLDLAGVSTAVLEGGEGPLVGHSLGGSIAARFAISDEDRLSRLVLVDAGSLGRFRPASGRLLALIRFMVRPGERALFRLLRQMSVDPDGVRLRMGERWEP